MELCYTWGINCLRLVMTIGKLNHVWVMFNTRKNYFAGGDGHDNAIDRSTPGAENTSEIYLLDSEKDLRLPALEALWK